jgi:hypothetical protein
MCTSLAGKPDPNCRLGVPVTLEMKEYPALASIWQETIICESLVMFVQSEKLN